MRSDRRRTLVPSAGYSGTPLAKKLGLVAGSVIKLVNPPSYYRSLFAPWPDRLEERADDAPKDFIHVFAPDLAGLVAALPALKSEMKPNAALWASWPKKTSAIKADFGENDIRALALANGLVDVKVCAIDATWSALKLVIPIKQRPGKSSPR